MSDWSYALAWLLLACTAIGTFYLTIWFMGAM